MEPSQARSKVGPGVVGMGRRVGEDWARAATATKGSRRVARDLGKGLDLRERRRRE